MKIKLYQMQVAAGAACALLLGSLRHGAPSMIDTPLLSALEALSFLLCCTGTIVAARALRNRYEALGANRTAARTDPSYMQDRRETQISAALAVVAVSSLAASRYGLNPLYVGLTALIAMALILPLTNRAAGWSGKA